MHLISAAATVAVVLSQTCILPQRATIYMFKTPKRSQNPNPTEPACKLFGFDAHYCNYRVFKVWVSPFEVGYLLNAKNITTGKVLIVLR